MTKLSRRPSMRAGSTGSWAASAVPPKIVQSAENTALLAMLERFSVGP
jgi:hypothetical protein